MGTLIVIGLLGGLITGISPCILPMLPVIFFAGGVQGARPRGADDTGGTGTGGTATATATATTVRTRRSLRPYIVIAGLVVSFTVFTLLGSLLLTVLGLPQDLLRWAGITLLILLGIGMIVPRFETILERPFQRIAAFGAKRGAARQDRGAFVLGMGLGVLYVPCAGPVLAAITVAGATGNIGPGAVALTVSFAVGAALPLLVFALAGRRIAERVQAFQRHTKAIRTGGGVVVILLAIALALNLPAAIQRQLPDYTGALQERVDSSETVRQALDLGGLVTDENRELSNCSNGAPVLEECGTAPEIRGIDTWLNTPEGEALRLEALRGQVVLVDFWTYSCINCQRAIPHLNAWYDAYADVGEGFEVIGVHTPEFAFERETRNVIKGAEDLDVTYPIAQDNSYSTWTAYRNRYWPAQYLIDSDGAVRHIRLGEGGYENTEKLIRELLTDANPGVQLPAATTVQDASPLDEITPETYFSIKRVINYAGEPDYAAGAQEFVLADEQQQDTFSLGGSWEVDFQGARALSDDAQVRVAYRSADVFVVLGGEGTVEATVTDTDGEVQESLKIDVSGNPRLYPVLEGDDRTEGLVDLKVPEGVQVFTMTFG
ncbi:cytochrome c biogenesis protein CcdA [Promicromonospora iranensis]|uniref:Cytochrome c biogenesis protein CcdA/thiol-disulfide isomerase/thioredoxin n=1 Tax=Promicromonospora iranensis TaxID=1105144 RepID=A0ABU2CRF7_9MICO|nr:cytochrome c biogenesis protein CcdA [Promicromonospora iranensis]MDR7383920.1 cytochrome c biogenesis protein CcdA/thiol-disulfide isomerase/thioredoxin [Promicromonospora iranensis]